MDDKLFFGEVEREAKKAESAYMKSRGAHSSADEPKIIEVAGNPGTGLDTNK